jgi:hypothetical protein
MTKIGCQFVPDPSLLWGWNGGSEKSIYTRYTTV